jgi:hypothetical protein
MDTGASDSNEGVSTDNYDVTTALPGANATCDDVTTLWNDNFMLFMAPVAVSNNYDIGYMYVLTQSIDRSTIRCQLRCRIVECAIEPIEEYNKARDDD